MVKASKISKTSAKILVMCLLFCVIALARLTDMRLFMIMDARYMVNKVHNLTKINKERSS